MTGGAASPTLWAVRSLSPSLLLALVLLAPTARADELRMGQGALPKGARVDYRSAFGFDATLATSDGSIGMTLGEHLSLRFRVEDDAGERVRVDVREKWSSQMGLDDPSEEHDPTEGARLLLDHTGAGLRVYRDGHIALDPAEQAVGEEAWHVFNGLQSFAREVGPAPLQVGATRDLTDDGDLLPLSDGAFQVAKGELHLDSVERVRRRQTGVFSVVMVGGSVMGGPTMSVDLRGQATVDAPAGLMTALVLGGTVAVDAGDGGLVQGTLDYHFEAKLR